MFNVIGQKYDKMGQGGAEGTSFGKIMYLTTQFGAFV